MQCEAREVACEVNFKLTYKPMRTKNYFITILAIAIVAALAMLIDASLMDYLPVMAMATPVVLPTQQIVFLRSLQEEYKKIDTWLNEAQDLSSFVADGQTLRFPEAGAAPEVYKNTTNDIDSVEPQETVFDVVLDYYDSQNYKVRNIHDHALPYDKIQYYTRLSSQAIIEKEVADAAYTFAPDAAGAKKVVLPTTGDVRDTYKMCTLTDIVNLARACDKAGFPDAGRNLVLPSDMWWDLVANNEILKAQLSYQQNNGVINPTIVNYYGFKIHKSATNNLVSFDVNRSIKAPQGSVITGSIVPAGFVFVSTNVFRASGAFEMFLTPKQSNPTGRATEFGFSHRFKADFVLSGQRYSALLYQSLA